MHYTAFFEDYTDTHYPKRNPNCLSLQLDLFQEPFVARFFQPDSSWFRPATQVAKLRFLPYNHPGYIILDGWNSWN